MSDASWRASLERVCAIVAHKDAQPLRRALFARKAAITPAIRAALATWAGLRGTAARTAFVAGYGALALARLQAPVDDGPIWSMAEYDNEARQIDALARLAPELGFSRLRLGPVSAGAAAKALREAAGRDAYRLLEHHVRGGDFLVAARVASTLGHALAAERLLGRSRARAVLVSSDTNPATLGVVGAAEALGRRTCFVTHGFVAESPPPLAFDLSILDGPAVRDVYARAGEIRGRVVFRGVEGRARPLRTGALRRGVGTLGVFLSILFDAGALARHLETLRARLAPERMLLRLHPNRAMRDPAWARGIDLRGVVVSDGARSIAEDCDACDLVAAGSSSAHLSALKLGVPTIYVPGLDEVPDDYYGFVARGVVPRLAPGEPLDGARLAQFYEAPAWGGAFASFDAAYPDRQDECDDEVRRALRSLVA